MFVYLELFLNAVVQSCFGNTYENEFEAAERLRFQNKIGDTALHAAAWRGHTECVSLLLEAGANPRVRNKERKMPIEQAKDVYVAALLQSAMRTDTTNEEEANEYESGSDEDSSASHPARF